VASQGTRTSRGWKLRFLIRRLTIMKSPETNQDGEKPLRLVTEHRPGIDVRKFGKHSILFQSQMLILILLGWDLLKKLAGWKLKIGEIGI
jgi:hypothetical protein